MWAFCLLNSVLVQFIVLLNWADRILFNPHLNRTCISYSGRLLSKLGLPHGTVLLDSERQQEVWPRGLSLFLLHHCVIVVLYVLLISERRRERERGIETLMMRENNWSAGCVLHTLYWGLNPKQECVLIKNWTMISWFMGLCSATEPYWSRIVVGFMAPSYICFSASWWLALYISLSLSTFLFLSLCPSVCDLSPSPTASSWNLAIESHMSEPRFCSRQLQRSTSCLCLSVSPSVRHA